MHEVFILNTESARMDCSSSFVDILYLESREIRSFRSSYTNLRQVDYTFFNKTTSLPFLTLVSFPAFTRLSNSALAAIRCLTSSGLQLMMMARITTFPASVKLLSLAIQRVVQIQLSQKIVLIIYMLKTSGRHFFNI